MKTSEYEITIEQTEGNLSKDWYFNIKIEYYIFEDYSEISSVEILDASLYTYNSVTDEEFESEYKKEDIPKDIKNILNHKIEELNLY